MKFPESLRVSSCCCCFSLSQGTVLIGFLDVVGSIVQLTNYMYYLITSESVSNCQQLDDKDDSGEDQIGRILNCKFPSAGIGHFVLALGATLAFINFIASVLLIYGAKVGRPRLLLPWLGWTMTEILFYTLFSIGFMFAAPFVIPSLISIILLIYFFLVVTSFYITMCDGLRDHTEGGTVADTTHPTWAFHQHPGQGEMYPAVILTSSGMAAFRAPPPGYHADNEGGMKHPIPDDLPPPYPGFTEVLPPPYSAGPPEGAVALSDPPAQVLPENTEETVRK